MRSLTAFAVLVLSLSACSANREHIREGLIARGETQQNFIDVWGAPTKTSAVSGADLLAQGGIGTGNSGGAFKPKAMYEVWTYDDRKTMLVFRKRKLIGWKSEKTVQQLAQPAS